MLRRRVATRSEKARLQASPVGESILAAIMEAKGLGSGPEAVVPRALQLVDVDIQLLDAEQVMAEVVVSGAGVVESEELELEAFPLATETSAGTPPPPITPAVNATRQIRNLVSVTATTPITFTSSISVSTSTLTIPSLIPATTTPSTVSANHSNATFSQPTAAPAAAAPPPSHQPPSHQHIFPAMVPRKRKPTASMEMGAFPPAPATPSTSTSAASSASSSPASSSSHVVVGVGGVGYVHKLKRLAGAPGGEGKEGS
ncbi:hypothetical protein BC829DRAFT_440509 [Chytridium lagenaria]|nr:hypothetical protein BC829DRAFT_440509 [Chytridium lagenaria]